METEVRRIIPLGETVEVGMESKNGAHEIHVRDAAHVVFLDPEQARRVVQALKQLIDIAEEYSGK